MNTAFLPENKWNDNRNVDENEPTLFDLYEQGDFKSLRRKILQRNDLNAPCGEGEELLFVLAQNNNEDDALQAALTADLLLKKGVDPNAYDTDVCTPLIYAIISNNLKLAACLISAGADVNRAADGPPLMHAQTLEALTFLLENGADPNRRNFYGSTPILSICENFEPELYEKAFSLLLKYGADPNVRNYFGQTLVCRVVQSRCELNTLRFIVEELEGDFYTPDFDGFPPVFFTGSHVDSEIFHYLVEQGADVFCVTKNERTLLYHVLCTFSNTKLAHELIETYHFDVNARPSGLMTLLQLIPTRVPTEEAKEMMRFLIAHGAHVLPHDSGWSFVIMMLLQNRKLELFDFLLDELGVDFNVWYAESYSSYTVLESAVSWKFSMEFIQELVQKQHPNQMHFNAALAQAVEQNDFALVEYFVTQGADPQAGVERVGPYTDIEILQLLYQNGADLNEHSHFKKGETLLHRGNFEMIQFLVEEAGLDIFTLDAAGHTPLYHAVKRKNFEIAEYLLERGAAAGIDTHELLFPAIETQLVQSDLSERFSFFRTLMEVGVKINVQNSDGETPLMLAAQIGDSEAV